LPLDEAMDDLRSPRTAVSHGVAIAAAIAFVGFALFSIWQLDSGSGLDHLARRFTDWFMRGWVDASVSSLGPLAEPEFATGAAVVLAAVLVVVRGWRVAALAIGAFTALAALELGIRAAFTLTGRFESLSDAVVHAYPSGHAARVPLLAGMVAALLGRRARWAMIAVAVVLALLIAIDRVDSGKQNASDVTGGLLLGLWMALTFAALLPLAQRR
jgi:membrane-associated phospholipid phosphatase